MKIKRIYAVATLIFFIVSVFISLAYALLFGKPEFENITALTMDKSGNIYCVDESKLQSVLYKTDRDEKNIYTVKMDRLEGSSYYKFKNIVPDESGALYVHKAEVSSLDQKVLSEKILYISPDGKTQKTIYIKENSNPVAFYSLDRFSVLNKKLLFFEFDFQEQTVFLKALQISNNFIEELLGTIAFEEGMDILEINAAGEDLAVFSTRSSELYAITLDPEVISDEYMLNKIDLENSDIAGKQPVIPYSLSVSGNGNVIGFVNAYNGDYILYDTQTESLDKLLDGSSFVKDGDNIRYRDLRHIKIKDSKGSLVANTFRDENNKVRILDMEGSSVSFIESPDKGIKNIVFTFFTAFLVCLLIYAALSCIIAIVTVIRVTIVVKMAVIFIPVVLIGIIFVYNILVDTFSATVQEEIYTQLYTVAGVKANSVDPSLMEKVKKPVHYMGSEYQILGKSIDTSLGDIVRQDGKNTDRWNYSILYGWQDDKVVVKYSNTMQIITPIENYYDYEIQQLFKQTISTGNITFGDMTDDQGVWLFALAPVKNSEGTVIGVLETGTAIESYQAGIYDKAMQIAFINLVLGLLLVIIFITTLRFSMRSLRSLRQGVAAVAEGHWGIQVNIRSNDEVTEIGRVFNRMSKFVEDKVNDLQKTNKSLDRFLPYEKINILQKKDIFDLKLGDQAELEVCTMFANTRFFFELTSNMKNDRIFTFINEIFGRFAPVVDQFKGLIDWYDMAGIFSLFPVRVENAIDCAIAIRERMHSYNLEKTQQKETEIDVGIAINKGNTLMGIVGQELRLSVTSISEQVNIVLVLEKLSIKLGSSVLVTGPAFDAIIDKNNYHYRYIGVVLQSEKKEIIRLYDFFDGDAYDIRDLKSKTKPVFDRAISLYYSKDFYEARKGFIEVLRHNPYDKTAQIYLVYCDTYISDKAREDTVLCLEEIEDVEM